MTDTALPPVRKHVTVARPLEEAFRVFTSGIGTWWPLKTHSANGDKAESCVMEERVGGRLYERSQDGQEVLWGTVRVWAPPHRVVFSWHPGRAEDTAQEIEVRFSPLPEGTRVDLEHRGWERLGKHAEEAHRQYTEGWDNVFGRCFVQRMATTEG